MRFDFNAIARNFDGSPIEQQVFKVDPKTGMHLVNERGELAFDRVDPVPLKKFAFDLLGARLRGEENLAGAELFKRYEIASKIAAAAGGATELASEDVAVLLAVFEKGAAPLVYGQVKAVLDNPLPAEG